MLRYFIKTFGCQMNFSDSERLASFLEKNKFKPATRIDQANLVIFNSCGIRKMPEDRAFGQIHNLKKNNPKIKIALTGCISHRKDVQKVLEKKVDLFFPIKDFNLLENFIIESFLEIGNLPAGRQGWKLEISAQKNNLTTSENIAYLSINPKLTNNFSADVPIMTGCNNFCAYCVVPYARGKEVSRSANEIITEIKALIRMGYKEITLLGQNVNSYTGELNPSAAADKLKISGSKKSEEINFSQLLKMINDIPGNFWLRFMSSHPKDMSTELIETITTLEKVCESVHLPIQSGNDKILKKMNRKYTRAHYLKLIEKIKAAFKKNKPNKIYSISSDIIIGFPGETKKQLEDSASVMRQTKYDMVYFGQFSPRPETVAWKMKDNVTKIEKERREKYLNEILKKTALENNKQYLGKTLEVLIDKKEDKSLPGDLASKQIYYGKTRTLKNVKVTSANACHPEPAEGSPSLIGKIVKVKITKISTWNLEGKLI